MPKAVTETSLSQIVEELRSPFPTKYVHWKPQKTFVDKGQKEGKALAVAYVDARTVAERFDQVVGVFNWFPTHAEVAGGIVSGIGVWNPEREQWLVKWDKGSSSNPDEAMQEKGTVSDGFKRAAVTWGVARYLYWLPAKVVKAEFNTNRTDSKGLPMFRRFAELPEFPDWAKPPEERGNGQAQSDSGESETDAKTVLLGDGQSGGLLAEHNLSREDLLALFQQADSTITDVMDAPNSYFIQAVKQLQSEPSQFIDKVNKAANSEEAAV